MNLSKEGIYILRYRRLLLKIKETSDSELEDIAKKLEIIHLLKDDKWYKEDMPDLPPVIDTNDLEDALIYCVYHFKGGLVQQDGITKCPCKCKCESCEVIPQDLLSKEVQNLSYNLTDESLLGSYLVSEQQ